MYLIFGTFFILIIVYFLNTILSTIKLYMSNPNPKFEIGNMWFVSLIIINLSLILFTCIFYYYKSQNNGISGPTGEKGNKGYDGDSCVITNPNIN